MRKVCILLLLLSVIVLYGGEPAWVVAATRWYGYPLGIPGRALGDGFFARHGYVAENTWFSPGNWHTGEDWYAIAGDTAGAGVYAVADGNVVYAGSNYPGRVVIISHADGLYSMYGHLDPALRVRTGQRVAAGALICTVLRRGDAVPNHLHFEIRTFLLEREVNGDAPRYGFRCGVRCPPGPGYWPQRAPDHPGVQGWRNPTHSIARRAAPVAEVVVAQQPATTSATVWTAPGGNQARILTSLALRPGVRYPLLAVQTGAEDARTSSAQGYVLWYRIRLSAGRSGWVQAAIASSFETGADGRPSTVRFNFYPARLAPR